MGDKHGTKCKKAYICTQRTNRRAAGRCKVKNLNMIKVLWGSKTVNLWGYIFGEVFFFLFFFFHT